MNSLTIRKCYRFAVVPGFATRWSLLPSGKMELHVCLMTARKNLMKHTKNREIFWTDKVTATVFVDIHETGTTLKKLITLKVIYRGRLQLVLS